jgi:hypothetical protein
MLSLTLGWFFLENKITENQWKIAEATVHFWHVLTVSNNFMQFLSRRKEMKSVK